MKATIVTIATAVLLMGCAAIPNSNEARLASMCKSYDSTLEVLTAAKSELSEQQVATINDLRAIANPICYNHDFSAPGDPLDKLEDVLARMNGIQANVGDVQ